MLGTEGGSATEVKKEEDQQMVDMKQEAKDEPVNEEGDEQANSPPLRMIVEEELLELQQENRRLHNLVTDLHRRHHQQTLQVSFNRILQYP